MSRSIFTFAAFVISFSALPVPGADQTVLGKSFLVKDLAPGDDPSLRSVVVLGKELASDATVTGDPLTNGATLEIIANGATSTAQTFNLPAGAVAPGVAGWRAIGSPAAGYLYKDALGSNGPVKAVTIKRTANGTFIVKVTLKGALGPGPQPHITVVPPAPGTDGGMRLVINGGDTYCTAFGGLAGGAETNAPTSTRDRVFKIASRGSAPTTETGCPVSRTFCTNFFTTWGTSGSADGELADPYAIGVDGTGHVYVADTNNHRIQKFTGTGGFLTAWGSFGSGNGEFNFPIGVAVDGSGDVYVVDHYNDRIQKFASTGGFLGTWGSFGSADGQFAHPFGVAVDGAGNVYVADHYNHRIQKFTSTGGHLITWGSLGSGDGQLYYPTGVAVDGGGNVYVADQGNHRIQKFTSSGTLLTNWGSAGSGYGQFDFPRGIAVDAGGNVYVADSYNHRVQQFTSTGTFFTTWGTMGTGNGEFDFPFGIAVDGTGNVHVADTSNDRIQKFGCP